MSATHEPRSEFIEGLQTEIRAEVQRRNRLPAPSPWAWMRSPVRLATAAVGLVLVSMAAGGAAVAAAYQAKANEQRDLIEVSYKMRLLLAKQQEAILRQEMQTTEQQYRTGMVSQLTVMEGRTRLTTAANDIQTLESQVAEIAVSGREPSDAVSAPLIGGRDYVSDRIGIVMNDLKSRLELEQTRFQYTDVRVQNGMIPPQELEAVQVRLAEVEAGLAAAGRKLEIRRQFLRKTLGGPQADLRVLEAEADMRISVLKRSIAFAAKDVERLQTWAKIGTAAPTDVARAQVRLTTLQSELAMAELDLALVQKRIKDGRDQHDEQH